MAGEDTLLDDINDLSNTITPPVTAATAVIALGSGVAAVATSPAVAVGTAVVGGGIAAFFGLNFLYKEVMKERQQILDDQEYYLKLKGQ